MRKGLTSFLAGVLLAAGLVLGAHANASCQGYCAERIVGGALFAGCRIDIDGDGNVTSVICTYA